MTLRELAEAATKGTWGAWIDDYGDDDRPGTMFIGSDIDPDGPTPIAEGLNAADAAYIEAAAPRNVLALLDRIAELEGVKP